MREEHLVLEEDAEGLVILLSGTSKQRPDASLTREQVIAKLKADGWEQSGTRDNGITFKRYVMDDGM